MKVLESLWGVPAYLPYLQPELTEEAVLEVEARIGFKLPEEYLSLLRIQNGGYLRWRLPDLVHDTIRGIGPNFPALEVPDWESHGDWLPFDVKDGKKLIPFDGDGHWLLCFDYRKNKSRPAITLVDTEAVSEEKIAGSFAAYLELLEPKVEESEFVIIPSAPLETLKAQIASALDMQIDDFDDSVSGYPVHRLITEREDRRATIWLRPNLVPHGFVRPEDSRYDELKDLMPGMVKRYPGLAEEAWILQATDNILPGLLAFLEARKVAVQPLEDCHGLI